MLNQLKRSFVISPCLNIIFWTGLLALMAVPPSFAGENAPVDAPRFSVPSLDGHELTLKEYGGKYLLVNFWATWCGPCKMEMPSLESLYQKFQNRNFGVIAVSNDIFGAQVVKPYIEAQNLTFPVGLDPKLKVSNEFGVISLPTTFLIDPQGKIIGVLNGAEDWSDPKTLLYFDQLLTAPVKTAETPKPSPCQDHSNLPC